MIATRTPEQTMREIVTRTVVDEMGGLKAQIANLKERYEGLRAHLVETGLESVEGDLFRATVSRGTVSLVDYKGLVAKLEPSARLVKNFTREQECVTVRVTSRNGR